MRQLFDTYLTLDYGQLQYCADAYQISAKSLFIDLLVNEYNLLVSLFGKESGVQKLIYQE
jgi:hypothetical protein